MPDQNSKNSIIVGILTDIQFWIPVVVLVVGVLILIYVS